jgi:non-specific protein-tyrosine kinase
MELREYTAIIWRWLWLICLGTVLAGSTAFIVSRRMTPIYQASTTLLISQARSPEIYQDILNNDRIAKTYAELMTQPPILGQVAAAVGLNPDSFVEDENIRVTPVRDTQLVQISVEDASPQIAAEVANTLPQVFAEETKKTQSARFAEAKDHLTRELETLNQNIENTQVAIRGLGKAGTVEEQEKLARLQSTLTQYQNTRESLLQSYESLRLTEVQSLDTITVVAPAKTPESPVRPRTRLNTLLAAVVGAMLATGVAFLIEYLDDSIKSPDDLRDILGLACLGSITRMPGTDFAERLITAREPRHPISEAYRTLRTNLQFSAVDTPLKTLAVTSAGPFEGKTTTAANLAVVMAQAGLSVILVDTDLRRPRLHEMFGLSNSGGGDRRHAAWQSVAS